MCAGKCIDPYILFIASDKVMLTLFKADCTLRRRLSVVTWQQSQRPHRLALSLWESCSQRPRWSFWNVCDCWSENSMMSLRDYDVGIHQSPGYLWWWSDLGLTLGLVPHAARHTRLTGDLSMENARQPWAAIARSGFSLTLCSKEKWLILWVTKHHGKHHGCFLTCHLLSAVLPVLLLPIWFDHMSFLRRCSEAWPHAEQSCQTAALV